MNINRKQNTIIEYNTGDGFRSSCLQNLISNTDLVIASSKHFADREHEYKKAISIHNVHKFVDFENIKNLELIIIDCRLTSTESKSHKALLKLCSGKQILITRMSYDLPNICSLMELLSVTKN